MPSSYTIVKTQNRGEYLHEYPSVAFCNLTQVDKFIIMRHSSYLVIISIVLVIVDCESLQLFQTKDGLLNLAEDHGAKLKDLQQKEIGDISICFRFYNIFLGNHFLMAFLWDFYSFLQWSEDGSKVLLFQKFKNKFIQPDRQVPGERIAPMSWHSYCMTASERTGMRKVYLDGEEVLADIMEEPKQLPAWFVNNITFMPKGYDWPNWTGLDKITDINIYNKTLDNNEILNWTKCVDDKGLENKIVDWISAKWTSKGVLTGTVNKSDVCEDKQKKIIYPFPFPRPYLESADFCHLLGGEIAVARDNKTAFDMSKKCRSFAGYNDLQTEGIFIDPYTREELDENRWQLHEPNNFGTGEDCTGIGGDGRFNDISCSEPHCTLCSLDKNPQFELRGSCAAESLDIKYLMNIDENFQGVYDIQGWRKSLLSWNSKSMRWEFTENINSTVVAYCNDTVDYPFGVHR